jgi:hypothetical protein
MEFFEWLGNHINTYYLPPERPFAQAAQIAKAYVDNPTRKGLLFFLGCLAGYGNKLSIPGELLQEDNLETDKERLSALVIRVAQGDWGEVEARELAREFASLRTEPSKIWLALRTLKYSSLKAQSKESFTFALRDQLEPSQYDYYSRIIDFLGELLRQRRSNLSNSTKWKECGLPELP